MKKMYKGLLALMMSMVMLFVCIVPALANVWTFDTYTQGSYPFSPRGYSIEYIGSDNQIHHDWIYSDYRHDGTSGNQSSAVPEDQNDPSDEVKVSSIDDANIIAIYAWFDKNPTRSTLSGGESYKNFLAVKRTNDADFIKLNTIATVADANRNMIDPNGETNQWSIKITGNFNETDYIFAFYRGFQANNGNSLVLIPITVSNELGYIGYISGQQTSSITSAQQSLYDANKYSIYQYTDLSDCYVGSDSWIGSINYEYEDDEFEYVDVYHLSFSDFYSTLNIY